jgi:hypothetical protein
MLAADELAELAEDIRARGLLHPIVLDAGGRILDGRNRLAACEAAGVEPVFVDYDGDDSDGYALAVNIARRHMTKGQQAAVIAKSRIEYHGDTGGPSKQLVSHARVVRDHTPDLLESVISGATGIREAYEKAVAVKNAAQSDEAQLAKLRAEDAELANKVVEGDLSLRGAFAELAERQRKAAEQQRDARALLSRVVELLAPANRTDGFVATWAEQLGEFDTELTELIKRAADAESVLADLIERTGR